MNEGEIFRIKSKFDNVTSEELEEILKAKSKGKYSKVTYEIIATILSERGCAFVDEQEEIRNPAEKSKTINDGMSRVRVKIDNDANRLYRVSQLVYIIFNIANIIIAIIGIIISWIVSAHFTKFGHLFIGLMTTAIICTNIYVIAVLSTLFGKVLSNISSLLSSITSENKMGS